MDAGFRACAHAYDDNSKRAKMMKFLSFMTLVSFPAEFLQSGEIIVGVSLGTIFFVAFRA
jgi:hypothetical protein